MISIVIPNYNGEQLLKRNLPTLRGLLNKSKLEFELIVVDDASTDQSVEILRGFDEIKIIEHKKNLGFPGTADDGVRASKGEYVFIIKNDATPEKADYFELLLDHFKDLKVFAVSAASKTFENGKEEIRGQGIIRYFRGFFLHFRSKIEYADWLKTMRSTRNLPQTNDLEENKNSQDLVSAWADGASSVYKKDIYVKLGGFEKIYAPGYWEDVDLGYRAWKAGYKIEFEPKAILLHDFEQSSFKKKYGEKLKLINLRNQFNFLWCNADVPLLLRYIVWLPYHYLVALKNWDFTLIKAHLWSLLGSSQVLQIRAKRKKLHKINDAEVLQKF